MTHDLNSVLEAPITSQSEIEATRVRVDRYLAIVRFCPVLLFVGYVSSVTFVYQLTYPLGVFDWFAALNAACWGSLFAYIPLRLSARLIQYARYRLTEDQRDLEAPTLPLIDQALDLCKEHPELDAWRQKVVTTRQFLLCDLKTMQAWVEEREEHKQAARQRRREEAAFRELHAVTVKQLPQG